SLNGNALTVTGDLSAGSYTQLTCNAGLRLGASISIPPESNYDAIDVNGKTLSIAAAQKTTVTHLNGAGSVNAAGGLVLPGDGTFVGTVSGLYPGLEVEGAVPNLNYSGGPESYLAGDGILGNVEAAVITPGRQANPFSDEHAIATLHTKSLTFISAPYSQYSVDVSSAGADSIDVHGAVNLAGDLVITPSASSPPVKGQTFVVISNDGNDPVNGTFSGRPEGSVSVEYGIQFAITYHGGDGNDVVLTVVGVSKTWTGAANLLWSNGGNWSPSSAPLSGESLVFPQSSAAEVSNDLPPGTTIGPATFAGFYTIDGNPLTLTGDIVYEPYGIVTWNVPLTLGGSITAANGSGNFYTAIDVNGKVLTIASAYRETIGTLAGGGSVEFTNGMTIVNDSTFSGSIHGNRQNFNDPWLEIEGRIPNANYSGATATLSGDGSIGTVDVASVYVGKALPFQENAYSFGTLHTKSLTLSHGALFVDLNASGGSDQIQVTGSVSLGGALAVTVPNSIPAWGQRFVIIDNDGTDGVNGTFDSLPEGATVRASGYLFRISYVGGDGNDVELITAAAPSAVASQEAATSVIGEPVALHASVTSTLGAPAGFVTFLADGMPIGSAPLSNGTASLDTSALAVGSHSITAVYSGGGAFVSVATDPITHSVAQGSTITSLNTVGTPVSFGAAELRVSSLPKAPAAGNVGGTFTLREEGRAIGSGTIDDGFGNLVIPSLAVGNHTIVASYGGSTNFLPSDSAPFTFAVTEAPVQLDVSIDETAKVPDGTVVLKIFVTPATAAPAVPTGTIMISEGGLILVQQPMTGPTNVTLELTGGHHSLIVNYSGDANFLSDSEKFELDVKGVAPGRRRAVRH
ncbi:MAG TPA: Ig-like domain-containing protein, partial [Thermoanaerobaculia bacterium]|nr:Ig-like domain-containing protein [Thermoanaerobaculia bacterium]